MTVGLLLASLGVGALAAAACSVLTGLPIVAARGPLGRLAPAAQARLVLMAALAPAFLTLTGLVAWVAEPYVLGCHAHHCPEAHRTIRSVPLLLLGLGLALRVGIAAARAAAGLLRSRAARRRLDAVATALPSGIRILPVDDPQAFVLGTLAPRVYLSRGLAAAAPDEVAPVVAHERAHARRHDPLRRLVARVALAFHVPGLAAILERRLARAQEMAADAEAAHELGDPRRVARALVRVGRLRAAVPVALAATFGGDLEARVRALLSGGARPDRPRSATVTAAAIVVALLAVAAAHPIHSGAEILLGLLNR